MADPEPADPADEPVRVCICGAEAADDGVSVRCPACGPIRQWGVQLHGTMLYRCPGRRARRPDAPA